MLVLRPVQLTDLPELQRLARDSLVGVTSLPDDQQHLRERIVSSCASFASDVEEQGAENYFFVLAEHDRERLRGCSEVVAMAGFSAPFYSLRNRPFISSSRELNVQHGVPTLSLCQDLSNHTLLRGFHVDTALARTPLAELLSRARLLFIAAHPQRFADTTITEIVGYSSDDSQSPFWEALGKHFFDLPYAEAERLCGLQTRSFLADLMPQYPIYIPMLPKAAQDCIGQVHPQGQDACDILLREGFEPNHYVDLFDGGPTLYARNSSIRSIGQSRVALADLGPQSGNGRLWLVSNQQLAHYRAILAPLDEAPGDRVTLNREMLDALELQPGQAARLIAL